MVEKGNYYTYEYIEGESLGKLEDPASKEEFDTIAAGALSCLSVLHTTGWIHYDISPDNVVKSRFCKGNDVYLLDLGLAGRPGQSLLGTPGYMAPEIIRGEPGGAESDLYSLGVVLAERATASRLFPSLTQREILREQRHVRERLERSLRGSLGERRAGLVLGLLEPRRTQRLSDAFACLEALEEAGAEGIAERREESLRCLLAGAARLDASIERQVSALAEEGSAGGTCKLILIHGRSEEVRASVGLLMEKALSGGSRVSLADSLIGERECPVLGVGGTSLADLTELLTREPASWLPEGGSVAVVSLGDPGVKELNRIARIEVGGEPRDRARPMLRFLGFEEGSAAFLSERVAEDVAAPGFRLERLLSWLISNGHLVRARGSWVLRQYDSDWSVYGIGHSDTKALLDTLDQEERGALVASAVAATHHGASRGAIVGENECDGLRWRELIPRKVEWHSASPGMFAAVIRAASNHELKDAHNRVSEALASQGAQAHAVRFHLFCSGRVDATSVEEDVMQLLSRGMLWEAIRFAKAALHRASGAGERKKEVIPWLAWVEAERGRWVECSSLLRGRRFAGESDPETAFLLGLAKSKRGELRESDIDALGKDNTIQSGLLRLAILLQLRDLLGTRDAEKEIDRLLGTGQSDHSDDGNTASLLSLAGESYAIRCAVMVSLSTIGKRHWIEGRIDRAVEVYRHAEALARSLGMRLWELRHRSNAAAAELKKGREEALTELEDVAQQREKLGDVLGAGSTWGNIGVARFRQKDFHKALASWQRQMFLARDAGESRSMAMVNDRIAAALQQSGAWVSAKEGFEVARTLASISEDPTGELRSTINLVSLLMDGGWIAEAQRIQIELESMDCPTEERLANIEHLRARLECENGNSPIDNDAILTDNQDPQERELLLRAAAVVHESLDRNELLLLTKKHSEEDVILEVLRMKVMALLGEADGLEWGPYVRQLQDKVASSELVELGTTLAEIAIVLEGMCGLSPGHLVEEVYEFALKVNLPGPIWRARMAKGLKAYRKKDYKSTVEFLTAGLDDYVTAFRGTCCNDISPPARMEFVLLKNVVQEMARSFLGERWEGASGSADVFADVLWIQRSLTEIALRMAEEKSPTVPLWEGQIQRILSVTETLNSTRRLEDLLEQVVDSVLDLSDAEHGFVVLIDEEGKQSIKIARGNVLKDEEEPPQMVSKTIIERVCSERRACLIGNALDDTELLSKPSVRSLSLRSIMCVPLVHKNRLLGVIYVDNRTAAGQFTNDDLRLVEVFAHQAAVAIQNNKLFRDLEASYQALSEAHDRIVRSERLKVLGEMAGGVAHDFNNLLTSILVRAQLLMGEVGDPGTKRELKLIETAALDGASAIKRIQDFTRVRTDSDFAPFSIRDAVLDAIEFTRGRWKAGPGGEDAGRCRVSLAGCPVALVNGNVSEIREVFTNIILNGIQSMRGGGELLVSAEAKNERVLVEFRDEGEGMSNEVQEKVFDPFFTTKGERGTGLGLSVAFGIVTRHGGEIAVESEVGVGSRFTVELPVLAEASEEAEIEPTVGIHLRGVRVLLVDDEDLVRMGVERSLRELGCEVDGRRSGEDGLAALRDASFDVVLTDHRMSEMNGLSFCRESRRAGLRIPVVLMTGSVTDLGEEVLQELGVAQVLRKPFTLVELGEVMCEATGTNPESGRARCSES
jgi:signal transduction histidine kinase/CheY-like chemotaxis protein/tetratricopeptide (TPR) repeat protein